MANQLYNRRDIMFAAVLASTATDAQETETQTTILIENPFLGGFRFCGQCMTLFREGSGNGRCIVGGAHRPVGWHFQLHRRATDDLLKEPSQNKWRQCTGCRSVFFNGYQTKGACAALTKHKMNAEHEFWLMRDRPVRAREQGDWRFCTKCNCLFFDDTKQRGACPGGGSHEKAGYNFILSVNHT